MNATGRININSIRSQELERKTDILSTGTNSPATVLSTPLSVGPDLTVKAWVCLAFIIITNLM
jgi:hypothetical protein